MQNSLPTLVLFARAPEPGKVKTRLAPLLGEEGAAHLYRAFLEDAARTYLAPRLWTSVLAAEPDPGHPVFVSLFPPPWRAEKQAAGDLGERLAAAFEREFAGGAAGVLAVGSDHPALSKRRLREAFDTLGKGFHAAVIPAEDGGYCAIALSSDVDPRRVFAGNIPWSSAKVLTVTLDRMERARLKVSALAPFYDVDRPEDIARLARDLAGRDPEEEDYPHATARALRELTAREAVTWFRS